MALSLMERSLEKEKCALKGQPMSDQGNALGLVRREK